MCKAIGKLNGGRGERKDNTSISGSCLENPGGIQLTD